MIGHLKTFDTVVYFDEHLGAAHSKHRQNMLFRCFLLQKAEIGEFLPPKPFTKVWVQTQKKFFFC